MKKTETDLNRIVSEVLLEELLAHQLAIALTMDEEHIVRRVEPEFAERLGYRAVELIGRKVETFFFEESLPPLSALFLSLEGERELEITCQFQQRNREASPGRIRLCRYKNEILLLVRPDAEDDDFAAAQHMRLYRAKAALSALLSLDDMMLHLHKMDGAPSNVQKELTRHFAYSRESLMSAFREITGFETAAESRSRTHLSNCKPCMLHALLGNLCNLLDGKIRDKGCTVTFENRCEGETTVFCDPFRLQQLMLPIVFRDIEQLTEGDGVRFTLTDRGDRLEIGISRSGSPIPDNLLPFLFRDPIPGVTDRAFVLPSVQAELRSMDGSIRVENVETLGTVFIISLPRYRIKSSLMESYRPPYNVDRTDLNQQWEQLLSGTRF